MRNILFKKIFFILLAASCATPWVSPPFALLGGFLFTLLWGNPFPSLNGKLTSLLLKTSIVGLGFGINMGQALQVGAEGFWLTLSSISLTLVAGYFIGKRIGLKRKPAYLISSGTAICGGSAIAAVAPVVKASEEEISTSLGVVFLLNSIALLVFPVIGHAAGLTQSQFGLWSAVAIHDTSSVVGAAASYGEEALQVATTVKLARTLWIIPLCLLTLFLFKSSNKKINIPWFIAAFIAAICMHSYFGFFPAIEAAIVRTARAALVVTLFFIGANLSLKTLRSVGGRSLALGLCLWLLISVLSFVGIVYFY